MPTIGSTDSEAITPRWTATEFFAGIGLARSGLAAAGIDVVWSNDISATKAQMFERNFPTSAGHQFVLGDLGTLTPDQLPPGSDLAWASFPCTDLSVAGTRAGLHRGPASSSFWHFIKVISRLGPDRPEIIALENVTAFATSNGGRDLESAIRSLNGLGYSIDVLSIDARYFVPQSRPRLFLVGLRQPLHTDDTESEVRPPVLDAVFQNANLVTHRHPLPPLPSSPATTLSDAIELFGETDSRWWPTDRVAAFVASLTEMQRQRFETARMSAVPIYRTAYRRMRQGVPRWEIRDDGIAGCLRTSRGGSSKQAVVELGRNDARIRWMTPREYARLMGAPDYPVDGVKAHHAYTGFGDAVCVPVVEWLATHYFQPALEAAADSAASRGMCG